MAGPRHRPVMCSGYTPVGLLDTCPRLAAWHLVFQDGDEVPFETDLCGEHAAPLKRDADRNNEPVIFTPID